MPVKIRLARNGKKRFAFYSVVIADSRSPRDGRFIEKLGIYNPNTNPATIDIDFDRAMYWLQTGAQPTDTCRAILSYKGVLYKEHLIRGMKKGALTQEQVDEKFNVWLNAKNTKIQAKIDSLDVKSKKDAEKRQNHEVKARDIKAAAIAKKNAKAVVKEAENNEVAE